MTDMERVAVCALTYLRPAGLRRLIDGLAAIEVPTETEVHVVIVDNDPERSARDGVDEARHRFPHSLHYVSEPARGISTARNAAVRTSLELGADAICFLDDDEWPDPRWLTGLVGSRRETGADVVTGTVIPVFDDPPPNWVVEGKFFDRRRHRHHEPMRYATTSTVLISADRLDDRPEPFDPAFGMSGGEDTHLFAQLHDEGARIVWTDDAVVYEAIPPSRVSATWIVRRDYRRGQTLSLSLLRRGANAHSVIRRIANGAVQIALGSARAIVGVVRGKAWRIDGVKRMAFGVGMLTGLAGRQFREYETTHGS